MTRATGERRSRRHDLSYVSLHCPPSHRINSARSSARRNPEKAMAVSGTMDCGLARNWSRVASFHANLSWENAFEYLKPTYVPAARPMMLSNGGPIEAPSFSVASLWQAAHLVQSRSIRSGSHDAPRLVLQTSSPIKICEAQRITRSTEARARSPSPLPPVNRFQPPHL